MRCDDCFGSGTCGPCSGDGYLADEDYAGDPEDCGACCGDGCCPRCHGEGLIPDRDPTPAPTGGSAGAPTALTDPVPIQR